jgi:uncharacterized protein YbjT (DUF2867 family)
MRVTVTGAGSVGGAEIVRRLVAAGFSVRGTTHARRAAGLPRTRAGQGREGGHGRWAGYATARLDFLAPETLDQAFAAATAAVIITPEHTAMVSMTANLVAAAERAGCSRLVLISLLQADSGPVNPLMMWHLEAERIVRHSPIASTCLRPNYYMQNWLSPHVPVDSLGEGAVSYVDVRDVADVVVRVLSEPGHEGKTYSLTGPRALSMHEVAAAIADEPVAHNRQGLSWQHTCLDERRSSHSLLVQALCEHWIMTTEDHFATVTSDVEQLTEHAPRDFLSFVQDHRGRRSRVEAA